MKDKEFSATRIKFTRMNFETECYNDLATGKGFLITDVPFSDIDKSIKNIGGPRSPLYGTTYNDPGEFLDRYRCKCGLHTGAAFEGEICPQCLTAISHTDVDIKFTGWLDIWSFSFNCGKLLKI